MLTSDIGIYVCTYLRTPYMYTHKHTQREKNYKIKGKNKDMKKSLFYFPCYVLPSILD